MLGIAETLVVALCYATGPLVISRKLADLPAIGVITASLVVTAAVYSPAGIATMPSSLSAETIGSVAVLAVVCTVVAFLVFFALIREVGPSRTTLITYVNPLVAVLLGVALLSEPFTLGIAVGMPLILAGLSSRHGAVAQRRRRPSRSKTNSARGHRHPDAGLTAAPTQVTDVVLQRPAPRLRPAETAPGPSRPPSRASAPPG